MCVTSSLPGLNSARLLRLMQEAIRGCDLNLEGLTVLTEAATGAYIVTPLIAALAGASRVFAVTKDSRFGSAETVTESTMQLASCYGVQDRMDVLRGLERDVIESADIVTNSGHVRPIDQQVISWMKPSAVVPLMYEDWELRNSDVDLQACRRHGIHVAGTNERHPQVGVFEFLGDMAVKLILDAGMPIVGSRIFLLCDNAFRPFLDKRLRGAGACLMPSLKPSGPIQYLDVVLVASTPSAESALSLDDVKYLATRLPGAVVIQFYGNLDRQLLAANQVPVWPEREPETGHMGVLPSAIGPEPIVCLQSGGLKVGEILSRERQGKIVSCADIAQPRLV
jgi:hypothetical protein